MVGAMVDGRKTRKLWDTVDKAAVDAAECGVDVDGYYKAAKAGARANERQFSGFGPGHKLAPGRWRWVQGVWERA